MTVTFDHVVITVKNLDQAITDFSKLGFHVTRGGAHGRTEMAMVLFADGTYLELITLRSNALRQFLRMTAKVGLLDRLLDRKSDIYRRLSSWFGQPFGPVDICVRVPQLDSILTHWTDTGLPCLETAQFERTRPDGQTARWRLGSSVDARLPFLIQDLTAPDVRVPISDVQGHGNGALGLGCVRVYVDDVAGSHALYEQAFPKAQTDVMGTFQFGLTSVGLIKTIQPDRKFDIELSCEGPPRTLHVGNAHIRLT
jgi:catechol 2,3-dioxygenase-like lactoylglutathione lyase family enzyme